MEIFFFILFVALVAVLAPAYGRDTRHLDDNAWNRDDLWSRVPRV